MPSLNFTTQRPNPCRKGKTGGLVASPTKGQARKTTSDRPGREDKEVQFL